MFQNRHKSTLANCPATPVRQVHCALSVKTSKDLTELFNHYFLLSTKKLLTATCDSSIKGKIRKFIRLNLNLSIPLSKP